MTDVVLNPISSGYNLSIINDNNDKIEQKINEEMLHLVGGNNTMLQDLDMNNNSLLNVKTDVNNPDSMLTVAEGDARYYNVSGDTLTGPMNVNSQVVDGLAVPVSPTGAVRRDMLDQERNERIQGDVNLAEADASLQAQINGTNPPMGSAFSVISWHDQHVTNSITIPDNKNGWSFGPTITIDPGQIVTIGNGSFWTVANGEVQP